MILQHEAGLEILVSRMQPIWGVNFFRDPLWDHFSVLTCFKKGPQKGPWQKKGPNDLRAYDFLYLFEVTLQGL